MSKTAGNSGFLVLHKAMETVLDREEKYGNAAGLYMMISEVWTSLVGVEIKPQMAPILLASMKLCRQTINENPDNLIDVAGYAEVAARVVNAHLG